MVKDSRASNESQCGSRGVEAGRELKAVQETIGEAFGRRTERSARRKGYGNGAVAGHRR